MRQRDDLVFTMTEYEARLARLRQSMAARNLDAFLVTTPENLFYLTGYQTPGYYWFQALVVPLAGEPFMVTRLIEDSNVQTRTWISESHPYRDHENPPAALGRVMASFGLASARIGYERHCYFLRATEQDVLFASLPEASFVDAYGLVEELRLIKSEAEIDLMRRAARTAEAGMRAGIDTIGAGVNENEVAAEIQAAMTRAGSHYPAIHPFVASGWRGAVGHATWEDRVIEPGDAVFLEIGGCRHRYHAAMMRTVIVGDAAPAVRAAERVVQDAMQACLETIRPGVPAEAVDRTARRVIAGAGSGIDQGSRTGYSIGIGFAPDWGEGHILSLLEGAAQPLEPNMTFHLIPWVQVPDLAGVGLTETVRVTASGCETLTSFERRVFTR
jgi:Xaa-Pro dipeptidase